MRKLNLNKKTILKFVDLPKIKGGLQVPLEDGFSDCCVETCGGAKSKPFC